MLDQLREGDKVEIRRPDWLLRSLKDVLHIMQRVAEARAGFRSVTGTIDSPALAGRMTMQMAGTFAEFDHALTREHACGPYSSYRSPCGPS